MAIYVVSGAILVYFLSEKIEKIQSNNRQLKSEKQELLEEYVELLKSTEKIDSLINERSASVKKQEILILHNFHCDYNDCLMNNKFIIDPNFNTVTFWDSDKKEMVNVAFNSTAQAIEFYANYMTILAY